MSDSDVLSYEFPCNEKIRTYLRLEALFHRFDWLAAQDSPVAHHCAIGALFDLTDATARSDLRNELVQGLERRRQQTEAGTPRHQHLTDLIHDITRIVGKSGQSIRENEWLQLIRTRQSLAGGTCEFDLPVLHHWLSMPFAVRHEELQGWVASFEPIRNAIQMVIDEIRANCVVQRLEAKSGSMQYPVNGRRYLLARIELPRDAEVIPEVSANKYMLWIRFSSPDENHKLHPFKGNVPFTLGLCTR